MRKMVLAILGMVIAAPLLFRSGSATAQNYPWCRLWADGATNCGFVSYEQCQLKGGLCYRNPMFQPPAEKPRARRRPSGQ
jgi:uncharacterized protein DUF3551